jgi:hypothetical protein
MGNDIAQHNLGIDQVLGAPEADHPHLHSRRRPQDLGG